MKKKTLEEGNLLSNKIANVQKVRVRALSIHISWRETNGYDYRFTEDQLNRDAKMIEIFAAAEMAAKAIVESGLNTYLASLEKEMEDL